jgi:uncharacterized protein
MLTVNETEEGVTFAIRVLPKSSKPGLAGLKEDALRIRITAPPVEGRANEESIRFLATLFNVKRNQVTIKAGHKSKKKLISIVGLKREDILAALPESCGTPASGLLF